MALLSPSDRMISHLNSQVDMLQLKNRDLERQLVDSRVVADEAENKYSRAKARTLELEGQLLEVDHVAAKLKVDKDVVVRAADREMDEAKTELEKSRHELEDMDSTIAQMRAENKRLSKENVEFKGRLTQMDGRLNHRERDNKMLEELLDQLQEEKRRLIQRNNKALANEKELILEIERMKRKNGPGARKGKIPSKLDVFIKGIEEDRDYYRQQCDHLQRMVRGEPGGNLPAVNCKPGSRSASPVRAGSRSASPVRGDKSSAASTKKALAQQEAVIRVLEEEKDYYKKEYEALKALRRSSTPVRSATNKGAKEDSELFRLTRERDELKALLDKFERHMAEIQANVSVLTSERDKLNTMYQETKDELMHVRRELISSPKSPKTSLAAQAVLRRVENERDDAVCDVRRLTTERDSLRERMKIATESALSERAKMEQRVEDLENIEAKLSSEREELIARLKAMKDELQAYEEQTKDQSYRLNQLEEELARSKAATAQLRLVLEDAEKTLDETRHRLARREQEVAKGDDRCAALESELAQATHNQAAQREELVALRSTLASLEREKDLLQQSVDDRSQKVALLNAELHDRERMLTDLKVRMGELEAQLLHANDNLALKDQEIKSLRRQLESVTVDLQETSRTKDLTAQENCRLQDDLAVMSKENQKLTIDLHEVMAEREDLKDKVQQYVLEVQRVEDMLANKESERTDLLEQYRKLSLEAEQFQTSSHQLESEGSNMRLELLTKDSELRRAHDKVENLEREIQEHLYSQQTYEQQVLSLTRSVTTLEETLRQAEDDKSVLRADYTQAKDLAAKLDSLKEQLQRKQAAVTMEKEQLQSLVEDLQQESECLREQVDAERATVKNLECLLQNNREKDFQSQLMTQERNTEIQMLKDRLSLNDSKLQSQAREVASLRTRNVELEGDVERLRRQLTNERFERERAVQELRRNGISPPMMIAEYTTTTTESFSRHSSRDRGRASSRSPSRSPPRYRSSRSPERVTYDSEYTTVKSYSQDII